MRNVPLALAQAPLTPRTVKTSFLLRRSGNSVCERDNANVNVTCVRWRDAGSGSVKTPLDERGRSFDVVNVKKRISFVVSGSSFTLSSSDLKEKG